MTVTLVLPGGTSDSLDFLRKALAKGEGVIGASSMPNDPAIALYPLWSYLPDVTEKSFEPSFLALIKEQSVDVVYTRHPIIRRYLRDIIKQHDLGITLDERTFADTTMQANKLLMQRVRTAARFPFILGGMNQAAPALADIETASLFHHSAHIDGQCSEDKILALAEIFRDCPRGDLIEIGSFWGRSAFVIGWLAHKYRIGSLLCVDPWTNRDAIQQDSPHHINDEAQEIDFDKAFTGFLLNVIPYSFNHINYVRGTSHHACKMYKASPLTINTQAFGTTEYEGQIACLHIDGNHDYKHVRQDMNDWIPLVRTGGWIVIDDYQWAFGDGPQIAADKWLEKNQARIACAFVTGSALFVKLRDD